MKNLGNPALVAALPALAPTVEKTVPLIIENSYKQQERGISVLKYVLLGGLAITGVFIGIKLYTKSQQTKLMTNADTDANVRAAMSIYAAIPDGLKTDEVGIMSIINPVGLVSDVISKIKLVWQSTHTAQIIQAGRQMKSFPETAKAFKTLYKKDLYELLSEVLSPTELEDFIGATKNTKIEENIDVMLKPVVTLKHTAAWIISLKDNNLHYTMMKELIPNNKLVGKHTGRTLKAKMGDNMTDFVIVQTNKKNSNGAFINLLIPQANIKVVKSTSAKSDFNIGVLPEYKIYNTQPVSIFNEQFSVVGKVTKISELGKAVHFLRKKDQNYMGFSLPNNPEKIRYVDANKIKIGI